MKLPNDYLRMRYGCKYKHSFTNALRDCIILHYIIGIISSGNSINNSGETVYGILKSTEYY